MWSLTPRQSRLPVLRRDNLRGLRREPPRLPLRRELAFAAALRRQKTEGEITRGCCLPRGADENRVKKRSFAFSLAYIKCFLAYSLSLSLRLPAQILYAGIHLPPQREARALPRRAPKLTASERKIVTKETHQGCLSFLFKSPLPCKGEARALPRRAPKLTVSERKTVTKETRQGCIFST